MQEFRLIIEKDHLFIDVDGRNWLLDTGAPRSFGVCDFEIAGQSFSIHTNYMGLTADQLSEFVGYKTAGIIGADVLNQFDVFIDTFNAQISFALEEIDLDGEVLSLTHFMGIPIINVSINDIDSPMFFDTGAQISYYQNDSLKLFPSLGHITDFFPGIGQFQTETYQVNVQLGNSTYDLSCGSLPELLGMTLKMAGVDGIIGNAVLKSHVVGYFARRQIVVLA